MSEANRRTRDYYLVEYTQKKRSPQNIAEEWGTYPNKIRRELKRFGIKIRNKSEAQTAAIEIGRIQHPTKGKKRSADLKEQLSQIMAENWEKLSKQEKIYRSEMGRQQWENMSDEDKNELHRKAMDGFREATKTGSKLERAIFSNLTALGHEVLFHSEHIIPGEDLQTDLYFPGLKLVIEIDGPSHVEAMWSEEALDKTRASDNKKNQHLLSYGFIVVRMRCLAKSFSIAYGRKVTDKILNIVETIKGGKTASQLIEIEVK